MSLELLDGGSNDTNGVSHQVWVRIQLINMCLYFVLQYLVVDALWWCQGSKRMGLVCSLGELLREERPGMSLSFGGDGVLFLSR